MTFTVPVICAWCKADMGQSEGHTTPDASHGICPTCFEEKCAEISCLNKTSKNEKNACNYRKVVYSD